jgi:uncharacterized repeat protein (TIGR01451 family)
MSGKATPARWTMLPRPRSGLLRAAVRVAVLVLVCGGMTLGVSPAAHAAQPASVNVTASTNPVASGTQLTYTIDVTNMADGATLDDVVLTDQVEGMTGLTLTSSVGSCSQTANLVTCDAGTLEGFQSWHVTIRGLVTAANGETLHNTATVAGTHASNTFTVSSTVSTLVSNQSGSPKPDLLLSVQGPAQIGEFQDVRYDLTVNNAGSAHATEVTVINTLPGGFSFLSASGTSLFVCANTPPGSLTVTCTGGRVNAGTNATITINAKSGADPGPFKNTAVVDPYNEIAESNELNNTGSLVSAKPAPPAQTDLTITKTDLVDPIRPGDNETYKIHVVNTAATRADSVSVVDSTQGLDAASVQATTTKGACTVSAAKVTCTQLSPTLRLNAGEAMDVTITGKVVATAGSLLTNTATVTGNIKNQGVSNTATTTTTVRPGVDLTVVQHSVFSHSDPPAPDAFRARDDYNYVITVGNSGLDDATNVVIREPLPEGVLLKGFTPPAGQPGVLCGESNGIVTCTGLTVQGVNSSGLAGGTVETIVLNVIAPPTIGPISATVTVDPTNAIYESDETNNTHTTPTNVVTGIDLTTMKDSEPTVAPSGTLIYTITVSNIGTQDTTGVVLRDTLPAGTRFREAVDVSNHNFTCAQNGAPTGGLIDCVGGILRGTFDHTLPVDTATIKVTLFAPTAPGLIKNQVRVDPDRAIPEIFEDNNINTRATNIQIGGCCAFNEFTIDKRQVLPASYVAPSGLLEYDVTVTNIGSDVAFGVVVRDFIPAGATFRFAEDTLPGTGAFSCTQSAGVINCTGGTLDGTIGQTPAAGDSTRTIHIGLFSPTQPGSYTNQALVDPDNAIPEANETNNSDVEVLIVELGGGGSYIDLKVDSMHSNPLDGGGNPNAVVPSGVLQYTLKVSNAATAVAFNVQVRDVIPTGARFRSAVDTNPGDGAFTCSQSGGAVTCAGGTLDGSNNETPAVGDNQRTIKIDLFAPTQPGSYTNQALIDPDNAVPENDETNNSDATTTSVSISGGGNYIDLKINEMTASDNEPSPNEEYTYTIKAENTGTDVAFNVLVRDFLPEGVTFVKATGTHDFLCDETGGVVDCTGTLDGSLDQAPNSDPTETITVKVRAPKLHNVTYANQVRIDPGNTIPEADETNNAKLLDVTVKSKVDLSPAISVSGLQSGQEGDMTFGVTATFDGGATDEADAPKNFLVIAELPIGVIPLNVQGPAEGWSCQVEQNPVNKVTCVGSLSTGTATASFTVHVYVTSQGDPITATVHADPDDRIVETDPDNNIKQSS